jgi:hypothetical protein
VALATAAGTGGAAAGPAAIAAGVATAGAGIFGAIQGGLTEWFKSKEGKARGGIASGSGQGFLEKLHGTEAVVPLPDGRTIPVKLEGQPQRDRAEPETRSTASAPRTEAKNDFSFMGALSSVTQGLSKAGSAIKDALVINPNELAAAFSKNKLDDKEVKDLLKTRTPVKESPGVFEAMFNPIMNGFKTITRDFISAKTEKKADKDTELAGAVKKLTDKPRVAEETKEQPRLTKPQSEVELSTRSLNDLKGSRKPDLDPMVSRITDAIKPPDQTKLLDRLKETTDRSPIDQAMSTFTGEVRKMSAVAPQIEIKDMDSLRQLSTRSITEALAKQSVGPGAENCSAMVAKYIEENRNQFSTTGIKLVEDFSKQLTGTVDKTKSAASDTVIARALRDLPTSNTGSGKTLDETGAEIKSGLESIRTDLTASLRSMVNELRGSATQPEAPDTLRPPETVLSTEELFQMLKEAILNGNNSVREAIIAQSEIMRNNLEKIDQLVNITDDSRGINQQMLNNIY